MAPKDDAPTAELYRLFDAHGRLLYIGISLTAAMGRLRRHRQDQFWWDEVAITTIEKIPKADAREIERRAIILERPRYNKHHNPVRPTTPPLVHHRPALVSWERAEILLGLQPHEIGWLVTIGKIREVKIMGAEFLRADDIDDVITNGVEGEAFGLNRRLAGSRP